MRIVYAHYWVGATPDATDATDPVIAQNSEGKGLAIARHPVFVVTDAFRFNRVRL